MLETFRARTRPEKLTELVPRSTTGSWCTPARTSRRRSTRSCSPTSPGSRDTLADLEVGETPAGVASAVEFVLEGLHLSKRLNKDARRRTRRLPRPGLATAALRSRRRRSCSACRARSPRRRGGSTFSTAVFDLRVVDDRRVALGPRRSIASRYVWASARDVLGCVRRASFARRARSAPAIVADELRQVGVVVVARPGRTPGSGMRRGELLGVAVSSAATPPDSERRCEEHGGGSACARMWPHCGLVDPGGIGDTGTVDGHAAVGGSWIPVLALGRHADRLRPRRRVAARRDERRPPLPRRPQRGAAPDDAAGLPRPERRTAHGPARDARAACGSDAGRSSRAATSAACTTTSPSSSTKSSTWNARASTVGVEEATRSGDQRRQELVEDVAEQRRQELEELPPDLAGRGAGAPGVRVHGRRRAASGSRSSWTSCASS